MRHTHSEAQIRLKANCDLQFPDCMWSLQEMAPQEPAAAKPEDSGPAAKKSKVESKYFADDMTNGQQ